MSDVILPIIHPNGTSPERLINPLDDAYIALSEAMDRLKCTAPDARDYHVGCSGVYDLALEQHDRRMQTITDLMTEIEEQIVGIEAQIGE
jgi:hypothetical protein